MVTSSVDVLTDVLGSTISVASAGVISADLAVFTDFGAPLTAPRWDTVSGFTGQVDTSGLLEFAARTYDPASAVWLQDDAYRGTAARSSSMNRYAYVEGAPESFVDAYGFHRAAAALQAQHLAAKRAADEAKAQAAYKEFMRTPTCTGYYGCYTEDLYRQTPARQAAANYNAARSAYSPEAVRSEQARLAAQRAQSYSDIRTQYPGSGQAVGSAGGSPGFWSLAGSFLKGFAYSPVHLVKSTLEATPFMEAVKFAASPSYYWQSEVVDPWNDSMARWGRVHSWGDYTHEVGQYFNETVSGPLTQWWDTSTSNEKAETGGLITGYIVMAAVGGRVTKVPTPTVAVADEGAVASTATRLAQDIEVNPVAPRALPLNRPVGGSASQNAFVQDRIASLQGSGATDFRVNQQQVNINGTRVGMNRPDLQYTLKGQRYYEEFDIPSSTRGPFHRARILANDPAVSRRGSNEEAFEGFSWGEESEARAGSFVELLGDGGQVGLVVGDRGALGQVLADQTVRVLVGAAFPGRVRVGEEHGHRGRQGEGGVPGHLRALVPGQGLAHHRGQLVRVVDQDVGQGGGGFAVGQREDQRVPGGALNQRGGGRLAVGADDQVALPVPGHPPVGDIFAGVDAGHPHDRGTALTQGSWSAPAGPLGAQQDPVLGEVAFGQGVDEPVDRLVGHRLAVRRRGCVHQAHALVLGLHAQPARDLPRGPRPTQIGQDPAAQHLVGRDLPDLRATAALLGGAVRVDQAVPAGLEPVPANLPRDHRRRTVDVDRDRPDRPPRLQPLRDLHPIRHRQHPAHQQPSAVTSTVATTL